MLFLTQSCLDLEHNFVKSKIPSRFYHGPDSITILELWSFLLVNACFIKINEKFNLINTCWVAFLWIQFCSEAWKNKQAHNYWKNDRNNYLPQNWYRLACIQLFRVFLKKCASCICKVLIYLLGWIIPLNYKSASNNCSCAWSRDKVKNLWHCYPLWFSWLNALFGYSFKIGRLFKVFHESRSHIPVIVGTGQRQDIIYFTLSTLWVLYTKLALSFC